jgi:sarcosine oxidase subunit beta
MNRALPDARVTGYEDLIEGLELPDPNDRHVLAAAIRAAWGGLYEDTPDKHPIVGPIDGIDGLLCAAGFSGHGVMHAPAVGQLVAEWIVDGRPSLDLRPLRLERFAERAVAAEANVI